MPALIPAVIGGGASIAGSLLSGKPKTSTSTSSTTPTLTPEMQQLMNQLSSYSTGAMQNGGGAALTTMKNASIDQVNRNYQNVPNQLASQFASRGYGSSGNFGNSLYQTEYQRQGALSGLESQYAQMGLQQQNTGANLGEQLLNFGKGSTSTGTGTTPDTSLQNGFLGAGSAVNGIGNVAMLTMFNNILKNQQNSNAFGSSPNGTVGSGP